MTTQEVAQKLVEYCRQGQYTDAQNKLYDKDVVSIEPEGSTNQTVKGMDAVTKKAQEWAEMVEEVHGNEISDPIVAGDFFAVTLKSDVTFKGTGRKTIEEVCVYEVRNSKVVKEQFFYNQ